MRTKQVVLDAWPRRAGRNVVETPEVGSASQSSAMLKCFLAAVCLGWLTTSAWSAGKASDSGPLATLRPGHPRLLVLDAQLAAVKERIKTNSEAGALYQQLEAGAEKIRPQPPLAYTIGGAEHTLLDVSRKVEGRVGLLAGLYRLNGDRRLAARAREEMLAAAKFPAWYPKHFLDTAEMTAALGIGYDWLYDYLSPEERRLIREAIVTKDLAPGLAGLSAGGKLQRLHNNWVQVCNGGLTIGALAVADEEKTKAAEVITLSREPMTSIMQLFAPEGGFEEGPTYWNYATSYNVLYLAALESALGTDFGLSQARGFAETGNYRMQTIGPAGKDANFADAGEEISGAPQMFWLAEKFKHPEYAWHEHAIAALPALDPRRESASRFAIFELLWDQTAARAWRTPACRPVRNSTGLPPLFFAAPGATPMRCISASKAATIKPATGISIWAPLSSTLLASAGPLTLARTATGCRVISARSAGVIIVCAPKATTP